MEVTVLWPWVRRRRLWVLRVSRRVVSRAGVCLFIVSYVLFSLLFSLGFFEVWVGGGGGWVLSIGDVFEKERG